MINNFNIKNLLLIFFSILFVSCSSKKLKEDKFIKVYSDLVIAFDTSNVTKNNREVIKQKVFENNDISEKQYQATLDFYNNDPVKWQNFFDKALAYVDSLKSKKN